MIENHFTVETGLAELEEYAKRGLGKRLLLVRTEEGTEDGAEYEIVDVQLAVIDAQLGAGYVVFVARPTDVKPS